MLGPVHNEDVPLIPSGQQLILLLPVFTKRASRRSRPDTNFEGVHFEKKQEKLKSTLAKLKVLLNLSAIWARILSPQRSVEIEPK